jgi:hypothetical protein
LEYIRRMLSEKRCDLGLREKPTTLDLSRAAAVAEGEGASKRFCSRRSALRLTAERAEAPRGRSGSPSGEAVAGSLRRRTNMSAEKCATQSPARLEWHPAHGEVPRGDPETFVLHVEFVHAHGLPKGEFTTFSLAPVVDAPAAPLHRL